MSQRPAAKSSDLFEFRKVADGVHVAVARPVYKVNSNTAIVETGDGLLVVDSHSKPSAARVVLQQLRDITPKPVRYVVNTHFHWDHWQGNEVYPAAYPNVEVITNDITREAMVRKSLKRIQDHLRSVPAEIAALKGQLAAATATCTPSATCLMSNRASPPSTPSCAQQSIALSFHRPRRVARLKNPQLTSTATGAAPNGIAYDPVAS